MTHVATYAYTLVTTLGLLAFATAASAEAAWVLWEHQLVPGSSPVDTWVIRAAWPDWNACKKEEEKTILDRVSMKPPEADSKVNRFGNTVTAQAGMRVLWSFQFICLPDTVDPGGPKGK